MNQTPGLVVDNKIDIDKQFDSTEVIDETNLSNATQKRLNKTLGKAKEKINSLYFPSPITENIPNNATFTEKNSIEVIYIDDSLTDLTKPMYFPQPSTNDRKDFKLDLKDDQMVIFKSPFLDTSISIQKEDLNNILENIAEDLDPNLKTLDMNASETQDTKQKKVIVKNIIGKLDRTPNKSIQEQLESQKWLQSLVDDQLKIENNFYPFGHYLREENQNKFKIVTKRKKRRGKSAPMTWVESEEPSINTLLPTNKRKSVQSAKKFFSNIIKNVPPEYYKKFKIEYSPQNNLTFEDVDEF